MKVILHLCADVGSDTYPYQLDFDYKVIKIGKDIGVENYSPTEPIHGVIANPVCTDFSFAKWKHRHDQDIDRGLLLVKECQRVIEEASPEWWAIENPATGKLKETLGDPRYSYEPWHYGSPWTKRTALWGDFNIPKRTVYKWEDVEVNDKLYVRPTRAKASLAFLHKSAIHDIPEFMPFKDKVDSDNGFRSLCSQGFAKAFKEVNP